MGVCQGGVELHVPPCSTCNFLYPTVDLVYMQVLFSFCRVELSIKKVSDNRLNMQKMDLKEPGVCRIFFSSPFRGLEIEREELTKKYWPQIKSYCNAQGLQFVPVDMRWGITTELSDSAQTIKICLKEINRSDIFVGFFGQVSAAVCSLQPSINNKNAGECMRSVSRLFAPAQVISCSTYSQINVA